MKKETEKKRQPASTRSGATKHKRSSEVTVARGVKEPREKRATLRKKAGSSNEGKYKNVSSSDFAGRAGGASPHSYPINTKKRAKAALAYAHNAPDPAGIRKAVHKKYKDL